MHKADLSGDPSDWVVTSIHRIEGSPAEVVVTRFKSVREFIDVTASLRTELVPVMVKRRQDITVYSDGPIPNILMDAFTEMYAVDVHMKPDGTPTIWIDGWPRFG